MVLTARTAQNDQTWQTAWATSNRERATVVAGLTLPRDGLAFKAGMLATRAHARALVRLARQHPAAPLVVDPLLQSTSGGHLWLDGDLAGNAAFLREAVLPWTRVVTPNWPELEALVGRTIGDEADLRAALAELPCAAVVKGGHAPGALRGIDWVWERHGDHGKLTPLPAQTLWQRSPRGTGCRLATALAIGLARGQTLVDAARAAKALVAHLAGGPGSTHGV